MKPAKLVVEVRPTYAGYPNHYDKPGLIFELYTEDGDFDATRIYSSVTLTVKEAKELRRELKRVLEDID